jgi:DNA-binding NarL/FixJ family response regulator
LKAGASEYLLKSVVDQDLVQACHSAVRERRVVSLPGMVSALARSYVERIRRGEALPANVLTSREVEVVRLILPWATRRRTSLIG